MCRDRRTTTHSPPNVRIHSTHCPTPFSTASSGGSGQVSEAEAKPPPEAEPPEAYEALHCLITHAIDSLRLHSRCCASASAQQPLPLLSPAGTIRPAARPAASPPAISLSISNPDSDQHLHFRFRCALTMTALRSNDVIWTGGQVTVLLPVDEDREPARGASTSHSSNASHQTKHIGIGIRKQQQGQWTQTCVLIASVGMSASTRCRVAVALGRASPSPQPDVVVSAPLVDALHHSAAYALALGACSLSLIVCLQQHVVLVLLLRFLLDVDLHSCPALQHPAAVAATAVAATARARRRQ